MRIFVACAIVLLLVGIVFSQDGPKVYSNYPEDRVVELPSKGAREEGQYLAWDGTEFQWTAPSFSTFAVNSISFGDHVGTLDWSTGELRFEGNFDESARIFFEYIWKNYCKDGRR